MSSLSGAQFEGGVPPVKSGAQHGTTVEADLLRRARAGDRAAFGQIALLYQDRLYNGIVRLVGDRETARDVVQETFARGLSKLDGFRGESGAYTWLFRIAMNLAITELRRTQRQHTFSIDRGAKWPDDDSDAPAMRLASDDEPAPAVVERRERAGVVLAALGRIDPDYRAVLVMRDVEGFDYQQMADVLGLPLGTLKSRLFRARVALRDELKEYSQNG